MKVPVGKGALVLWDNRTVHSTCAPFRGREDPKGRFLIYGTMAPASTISSKLSETRRSNLEETGKDTRGKREFRRVLKEHPSFAKPLPSIAGR